MLNPVRGYAKTSQRKAIRMEVFPSSISNEIVLMATHLESRFQQKCKCEFWDVDVPGGYYFDAPFINIWGPENKEPDYKGGPRETQVRGHW